MLRLALWTLRAGKQHLAVNDRLLSANHTSETLLGRRVKKLQGTSLLKLVYAAQQSSVSGNLRTVRLGVVNVSPDVPCRRRDESYIDVAWSFHWSSHHRKLFGVGRPAAVV